MCQTFSKFLKQASNALRISSIYDTSFENLRSADSILFSVRMRTDRETGFPKLETTVIVSKPAFPGPQSLGDRFFTILYRIDQVTLGRAPHHN